MSTKETAQEIVAQWKRDIGQVVKYSRMEADIDAALTKAIADERERCGRVVQQEIDASEGRGLDCEDLVRIKKTILEA
jgi:hypothetical protein